MVFPIPNKKDEPRTVISNEIGNRKRKDRKKKSRARKNKRDEIFKKKHRFVVNMSSWAEQFTAAATWQMKHELAYWKAKAVSLEYENKILHDIIRKNCSKAPCSSKSEYESDFRSGPVPKMYPGPSATEYSDSEDEQEDEVECNEEDEGNLEVSEEFIEFLRQNAKFKEDARREREKLKAQQAEKNEIEILEAGPSRPTSSKSAEMEELYGANWKKIAALEMSVLSSFMQESDKCKPSHWPNIPLNFG